MNKSDWHKMMRDRACGIANRRCQQCGKGAAGLQGVIQHKKYPPGVYDRDVEGLMNVGICIWLCRNCHDSIQVADDFTEAATERKVLGIVNSAANWPLVLGDRARTLGIDCAVCKSGRSSHKQAMKQDKAGQMDMFL